MSAVQQLMLGGGLNGKTLMQVLTDATLTTNLKLCLDAGDAASYDPSVQTDKWLDRSGGGYDFFRGAGTGVDAADPTFTGSASSLQSYWQYDANGYFTYDTTNEAWMQTLHKNAAIFTIVIFYYSPSGAGVYTHLNDAAGATGISFKHDEGHTTLTIYNAGAAQNFTGDSTIPDNAYHMTAVSITENGGAAGGLLYLDGGYDPISAANTWNPNYTSPSVASASATLKLGAVNPGAPWRLAALAVWQGTALTKANMDTIWAAMRGRFGI